MTGGCVDPTSSPLRTAPGPGASGVRTPGAATTLLIKRTARGDVVPDSAPSTKRAQCGPCQRRAFVVVDAVCEMRACVCLSVCLSPETKCKCTIIAAAIELHADAMLRSTAAVDNTQSAGRHETAHADRQNALADRENETQLIRIVRIAQYPLFTIHL